MTRPPLSKADWRALVLAARASASEAEYRDEAVALAEAAATLPQLEPGVTVCCYVPMDAEPGSLSLLDVLRARRARVLLPAVPARRGPLEWGVYVGKSAFTAGPLRGLREPIGDRLPPDTVAEAGLVLVPALAVDHAGFRLGRGAGYYDRTLALAAEGTALVAVIRDSELVPRLPREPHDVPMTAVLTPHAGYVPLPLRP